MNKDQLQKGIELSELISITQKSIEDLKKFSYGEKDKQKIYDDNTYWLNISQFNDGSGYKINLNRYYGNRRLLDIILKELEKQLAEFKEEFDKL